MSLLGLLVQGCDLCWCSVWLTTWRSTLILIHLCASIHRSPHMLGSYASRRKQVLFLCLSKAYNTDTHVWLKGPDWRPCPRGSEDHNSREPPMLRVLEMLLQISWPGTRVEVVMVHFQAVASRSLQGPFKLWIPICITLCHWPIAQVVFPRLRKDGRGQLDTILVVIQVRAAISPNSYKGRY